MHPLDRGEPGGEPDRESGEDDVEADDERELQSGQENRIEVHRHAPASPISSFKRSASRPYSILSGHLHDIVEDPREYLRRELADADYAPCAAAERHGLLARSQAPSLLFNR
jgi:hypothetical protein